MDTGAGAGGGFAIASELLRGYPPANLPGADPLLIGPGQDDHALGQIDNVGKNGEHLLSSQPETCGAL